MTTLLPLAGFVVVKRLDEVTETSSGIILAESAKEKPQRGEVISVGEGKDGNAAQVKIGQTILFKKYGPTEVDIDGHEMLLLEEEDILAIIQ